MNVRKRRFRKNWNIIGCHQSLSVSNTQLPDHIPEAEPNAPLTTSP